MPHCFERARRQVENQCYAVGCEPSSARRMAWLAFALRRIRDLGLQRRIARFGAASFGVSTSRNSVEELRMAIHLLAFVLVGGMAVGDSGDASRRTNCRQPPQP